MVAKKTDTNSLTVEKAAEDYEKIIKEILAKEGIPVFDMILLGVGGDGHTASWFPGTQVVHENTKLVSTSFNDEQQTERITLTPPLVLAASVIAPLVFGKSKANTLMEVIEGNYDPDKYPAQLLRNAANEVIWILDTQSAAKLSVN
jgi:6-phosphogluconolactonase